MSRRASFKARGGAYEQLKGSTALVAPQGTKSGGDNDEIISAVLQLLKEYTPRLHDQCEGYLKFDVRSLLVILVFIGGTAGIIGGASQVRWAEAVDAQGLMHMASMLIGIFGCVVGTWELMRLRRADILKRYEIRTTATRLEKVVRMGSQLEDHSIRELGTRMQLQLRLADAEAALGLVETVLKPTLAIWSMEIADVKLQSDFKAGANKTTIASTTKHLHERHS